jgi:hypothetical protein
LFTLTGQYLQVPWKVKGVPVAKESIGLLAKTAASHEQRDEVIVQTLSVMPHFLGFHLCFDWKRDRTHDPLRITVPFCPTKNVTQRLLLATEGRFETSEVPSTSSSDVILESQSQRVEAMKVYLELLKEQLK